MLRKEESTKGRTQTKKKSDGTYTSKEVGKDKRAMFVGSSQKRSESKTVATT